jgi:DNA-binding SARP family transcriptional activator
MAEPAQPGFGERRRDTVGGNDDGTTTTRALPDGSTRPDGNRADDEGRSQCSEHSGLDRDDAVEVAVLGRVEVRGVSGSFARRPKLTELVVFLALHPEGSTSLAWSTALWPHRRVPDQTISNRLSEARRLLGFAPDDRPRLRRDGELYRLADVSTDWARFKRLADRSADVPAWRAALGLVRGRPFEDLPPALWTAVECTAAEIEHVVTDCALRCGDALLERADYAGAVWAAHRGLSAAPWDERLHRLLMRTADATGNRAGVEATLRHLALVLEIDGDPLRYVHPDTALLYENLVGRSTTRAS